MHVIFLSQTFSLLVRVGNEVKGCCRNETGHMLYGCVMVRELWSKLVHLLNDLFNVILTKSPALCLLGIILSEHQMYGKKKSWCRLAILTGSGIILRNWKSVTPSSFGDCIELMTDMPSCERVTFRLAGQQHSFLTTLTIGSDRAYPTKLHPFWRAVDSIDSWSPESRYCRSNQYKWGTGMCLCKKIRDINQRLLIIFIPCSKKI